MFFWHLSNNLQKVPGVIEDLQKEKNSTDTIPTTESIDKQEAKIEKLLNFYSQAIDNSIKQPNGRWYPNGKDIHLLFYLLGKKTYILYEQILYFPSITTIKDYTKYKTQQLIVSSVSNPNLFNGEDENVRLLIDILYSKNLKDASIYQRAREIGGFMCRAVKFFIKTYPSLESRSKQKNFELFLSLVKKAILNQATKI